MLKKYTLWGFFIISLIFSNIFAAEKSERSWMDVFSSIGGVSNIHAADKLVNGNRPSASLNIVENVQKNWAVYKKYPAACAVDLVGTTARGFVLGRLLIGPLVSALHSKKNKIEEFKKEVKRSFLSKPTVIAAAIALGAHVVSYPLAPTQ